MTPPDRCIACGSESRTRPGFESADAHGVVHRFGRCGECGLLAITPWPSSDEITAWYDRDYYGTGERKFPAPIEALRRSIAVRRCRRIAAAVTHAAEKHETRAPRALDVGCGNGDFLRSMASAGFEIHGTELPGPAWERAQAVPGISLHDPELTESAFPESHFDVITLWHVLEHLPDPAAALRCCRRFITPSGLLIIEVPNARSWQARLFGPAWFHLDPPRHLHHFAPSSLGRLLSAAGFRVVNRASFSLEMGPFGWLQSALNKVIRPRDLFYDVLRRGTRISDAPGRTLLGAVGGAALGPVALAAAIGEAVAGHGSVLRITCSPDHQT